MKTTLIYVGIGVAGFNPARSMGDREGSWIGHGVASVGASARAEGFNVDLIDLRQLAGWGHFEEVVKEKRSDVFGLSVSPVDYEPALRAISKIKKVLPDAKIVVGGIHPSVFPDEYNFKAVDCVVKGEGEIAFPEILKRFESGIEPDKIVLAEKPDLDKIPWAARDLFQYQMELTCHFDPDQKIPSVTMLAGRGCPFKCTYCQPAENAVFGKPYRLRSPENVINEMLYLKDRYRYRSATFWDDTFTFNKKWVDEFCDRYERTGIGASITACSRADIICNNESMVKRMAEVGVGLLIIGMESGSQRILDLIKKGTTVEQNIEAAKICKKYGIQVFATFMYGLPTETREESLATAKMIDEINPEFPSPFWFTPIRGTDIYDFCEVNDLILDETKERTIARTGVFKASIKGVDYDYIEELMAGGRHGE